jgi:hypothetical protein
MHFRIQVIKPKVKVKLAETAYEVVWYC